MNKRIAILLMGILLVALPVWAIIEGRSYDFGMSSDFEKCSNEVEKLKLCIKNSKITARSGEQIRLELIWVNSSDTDRRLGNRRSGYAVTINDQNGKQLIPVFEQKLIEEQKRMQSGGGAEKGIIVRSQSGGDRGLIAVANGIEKDEIALTGAKYDYDLSAKGRYSVRIEKNIVGFNGNEESTFALDGIEIAIK